jgi:2-polyprenyl-6-methoxyphenol hydroxylase-like FAD-dependent oxidoreductase
MYDVIVVGARCAGSPTAMLLARKGYRVLVVDKATFPSDTLSTHFLWPQGAEALERWGLQSSLVESGAPSIGRRILFDVGEITLRGGVPDVNDGRGGFCARRTVLDSLLVNEAARSGAEVRERFRIESLVFDGDTVVGIRGRSESGSEVVERSRIVVGADGIHSLVAESVRAPEYDRRPVRACGYYSYFSNVSQDDIAMYMREHCAFAGAPTHDGLYILTVNWPAASFREIRSDIEGHVRRALAHAPECAARVNGGKREDRWYGTAGVPTYFRKPYGKGWALVGDAGYNRDPITAQGMSDAFIDAERLVEAIDRGFGGRADLGEALGQYESSRNARVRPMCEFTYEIAGLEAPAPAMQQLFRALDGDQASTNAFLSAITGATSIADFMSPENLDRIVSAART